MRCTQCRKEDAVVHVTDVAGGRTAERHFCGPCALAEEIEIRDKVDEWTERRPDGTRCKRVRCLVRRKGQSGQG